MAKVVALAVQDLGEILFEFPKRNVVDLKQVILYQRQAEIPVGEISDFFLQNWQKQQ